MWLLRACNAASATEGLKFKFKFNCNRIIKFKCEWTAQVRKFQVFMEGLVIYSESVSDW